MNPKKLGFGLMRLPLTDPNDTTKIDYEAMSEMVDHYMDAGFNYFDTAYPYHGGKNSEIAFGNCVAKRYPRDAYTITDKLSLFVVDKAEELEDYFNGQLERCGVDYFDYYLLHAMNKNYLELADRIGAFDFALQKKAEGKIRYVGFSFHDTPEVLEEILTRHPEMEYVQLQLNYLDWDSNDVQSRACYEAAVRHGKKVLVMEPVKGGVLANVPEEAETLMKEKQPDLSVASWAVRFAASLPEVAMVLSGMSNLEQMEDNLSYMNEFSALNEEEQNIVKQVADIIASKESIACTACRYCVDGCPMNIAIPDYFKLMNNISKFGETQIPKAKATYKRFVEDQGKGKASECIKCRQCEEHCPQHLSITDYLEDVAAALE